jgi:hypothetical protein
MSRNSTAYMQFVRESQFEKSGLGAVGIEGDVRLTLGYQLARSRAQHRHFVKTALDAILGVPSKQHPDGNQHDH